MAVAWCWPFWRSLSSSAVEDYRGGRFRGSMRGTRFFSNGGSSKPSAGGRRPLRYGVGSLAGCVRGAKVRVLGVGGLKSFPVTRSTLEELTAADAQADGFKSLKELMATLREIYPNHKSDGRKWYRVVFRHEAQSHPESPGCQKSTWHCEYATNLTRPCGSSGSLFPL